jgi:type I restriction enzyme R subunit
MPCWTRPDPHPALRATFSRGEKGKRLEPKLIWQGDAMANVFTDTAHREIHFEAHLVGELVKRGWLEGDSAGYDQNHALYPKDLVAWIKETQPKQWDKLVSANGARTTETLMDRLAQALEREGTVNVLRRGFRIACAWCAS